MLVRRRAEDAEAESRNVGCFISVRRDLCCFEGRVRVELRDGEFWSFGIVGFEMEKVVGCILLGRWLAKFELGRPLAHGRAEKPP